MCNIDGGRVMSWNPIQNVDGMRINFRNLVGAHSRISAICATPQLILAGGFFGELIIRSAIFNGEETEEAQESENNNVFHVKRMTNDENGITNFITLYHEAFPGKLYGQANSSLN